MVLVHYPSHLTVNSDTVKSEAFVLLYLMIKYCSEGLPVVVHEFEFSFQCIKMDRNDLLWPFSVKFH